MVQNKVRVLRVPLLSLSFLSAVSLTLTTCTYKEGTLRNCQKSLTKTAVSVSSGLCPLLSLSGYALCSLRLAVSSQTSLWTCTENMCSGATSLRHCCVTCAAQKAHTAWETWLTLWAYFHPKMQFWNYNCWVDKCATFLKETCKEMIRFLRYNSL